MTPRSKADDAWAISNLVAESHFLVDTGRWAELAEAVFAPEENGLVPEADFGFDVWRGRAAIQAGFDASMPRFDGAAHAVSNLHVTVERDTGLARYYVQGWHWVHGTARDSDENIDYLVVGVMTDHVVFLRDRWWVLRRRLERIGPGVALGSLPGFLDGLGDRPTPT